MIIWDEDLPQDNALSEANVVLSAIGTGEYGTLTFEGGYIFEDELSHTDWIIDPAMMDYDNLICIDGWYENADGSFHYAMYLRPWGTLWDDISADFPDNLPYYYESWYLPLIEAGKSMPDMLGGEAQDGTGEDEVIQQGGTESEQTGTAVDDEYGKSSADATGIAKLEDSRLSTRSALRTAQTAIMCSPMRKPGICSVVTALSAKRRVLRGMTPSIPTVGKPRMEKIS